MIDLGEDHPNYVASSILSKRIKEFHDNATDLISFLKQNTCFHEVSTDQHLDQSLKTIYKEIEPSIINIRLGKKPGLQQEITKNLVNNHGYINLDVNALQSAEIDRKTAIGEQLYKYATHDKVIPSSLTVSMLNKIIYCGQKLLNKFILSNFPEQIDQVNVFEAECAKISAIVYPSGNATQVEISNQELSLFNIESLF